MAVRSYSFTQIVAVGSAGSAAASATSDQVLNGRLASIGVAQGNTPHANTDITITITYGGVTRTLLTLTNYNTTTRTWFNVRAPAHDQTGTVLLIDSAEAPVIDLPLGGRVTVTVAQGGSASTLDVTLIYED